MSCVIAGRSGQYKSKHNHFYFVLLGLHGFENNQNAFSIKAIEVILNPWSVDIIMKDYFK